MIASLPLLGDLLAALAAEGAEVTALIAGREDGETSAGGARVRIVADGGAARALRRPARLIAAAREARPDVIHVHGLVFPVQTWWLGRALPGVPVLLQDHASRTPRRALRRAALRRVARGARGLLFTARAQADEFIAAGALDRETRLWEVPEASCTFTPGDRDAARRATGMHGDPCVLWVGLLDERKDPLTAIDTLALAALRLPDLRAWFCYGSAPLETAVRERLAAHPVLAGRVNLVGAVNHAGIEQRARAADVFLLASRREGCNLSTIESLACGTPVVVTGIPSQRSVCGDAGTYFEAGNAAQAADALVRVATAPRASARAAARRRFDDHLSYPRIARRLLDVYAEAMQ